MLEGMMEAPKARPYPVRSGASDDVDQWEPVRGPTFDASELRSYLEEKRATYPFRSSQPIRAVLEEVIDDLFPTERDPYTAAIERALDRQERERTYSERVFTGAGFRKGASPLRSEQASGASGREPSAGGSERERFFPLSAELERDTRETDARNASRTVSLSRADRERVLRVARENRVCMCSSQIIGLPCPLHPFLTRTGRLLAGGGNAGTSA